MDSFIPQEFQELIEHHAIWDEEAREWHLVSTYTMYDVYM